MRPASAPPPRQRDSPLIMPHLMCHSAHQHIEGIMSSPAISIVRSRSSLETHVRLASSPAANTPLAKRMRDCQGNLEEKDEETNYEELPKAAGLNSAQDSAKTIQHELAYNHAGVNLGTDRSIDLLCVPCVSAYVDELSVLIAQAWPQGMAP